MVLVPSGTFAMGCPDCGMPDALPVRSVTLTSFWIDEAPVTNAEFKRFVDETKFVTTAETPLRAVDFPGVPPEKLLPGSAVFTPQLASLFNPYAWWTFVAGANWHHPEGPASTITGRDDHPVVQVSHIDATRYCAWRGKTLPTEAQFEYAARGGLSGKRYAWGDDFRPKGKWLLNIWQGKFPAKNTVEDGYASTSPVKAFPANGYGLYDVAGNVWQWCKDWYRSDTYSAGDGKVAVLDPQGPDASLDPDEPKVPKRVQKGGSFLCNADYCTRYLVGSRGKAEPNSASPNVGFRCVSSP